MKKKQVLVACGAGIATSTVVNNAIEEICRANGIQCDLVQIKITEVGCISGYSRFINQYYDRSKRISFSRHQW